MSSAAFCTWEITNAAMCGSHRVPLLRDRRVSAVWYVASMARHTKLMLRDDSIRRRPYRVLCTGSLLTSEAKRRRARLVLGGGPPGKNLGCCRLFIFSVHIINLFLKWVPYTQGAIGFPNGVSLRHIKSDTRTNRASRPASQPDLQFQPISPISSNSFHSLSAIHPYTILNTHNTKLYNKKHERLKLENHDALT
jgi:hypothetical protein